MRRVVVVGGGVAGLATAFELRSADPGGTEVTVLEAASRTGGNLETDQSSGFICEHGPNGFLDNAPDTLDLVRRLNLTGRLLPSDDAARRRFLYRGGRLHRLPENPAAFLGSRVLSLPGRLRVLWEPFARARPEGDETIDAFAARRIGTEAAGVLVDSMVSGVFGGDARTLSLRASFPKMWEMETAHGSLVRAMLARRGQRPGESSSVTPRGRLTSFAGGVQDLVDALTTSLSPGVRTNTRVTSLARRGECWQVALSNGEQLEADVVVLAGGAAPAAAIVAGLDASLAATLAAIPSAPLAVVALGFDRRTLDHPLDGFGFLVPRGEQLPLLGALWDSSIFPNRAPEGFALVRVMLGGARDPERVANADDRLVAAARDGLATTMGLRAAPVWTRVVRYPIGIPQYTVGHLERVAAIDASLARLPGLFVTGNSFRGVSINACVTDAKAVAARVVVR